jgi:hypothetical protein
MKRMFYVVTFLSASVFILSLAATGARAETSKSPGTGPGFIQLLAATGVSAETCKPPGTGSAFSRLDFVNIGTEQGPDGEKAHEAAGWGPIEPATHGGNWGDIGSGLNCDLSDQCDGKTRVTWAGDCLDFNNELHPEGINRCLDPAGSGSPLFAYDPPTTFEPDSFALYGRAARVVLDPNALVGHGGKARQLRMRVLDGIGYDAFEVFVRNIKKTINDAGVIPAKPGGDTAVLVYRFDPYAPENLMTKGKSEQWRVHTIDLTAYAGQLNLHSEPNALEVILQATAVPWGLFYKENGQGGYGQLAVDWIEILGTPKRPVNH